MPKKRAPQIEQRGNSFYMRTRTPEGKRTWKKIESKDEIDAKARAKVAVFNSARSPGDPAPSDFWDIYSAWCLFNKRKGTFSTEERSWKRLLTVVEAKRMSEITLSDIERVKISLIKGGLAPKTVNNWLRDMKTIWNEGLRQNFLAVDNPFARARRLPVDKQPVVVHTAQECEKILKAAANTSDRIYVLCALCLYAGLRKREAIFARWENIVPWSHIRVLNDKKYRFQTKTNRNRAVPIANELRAILEPRHKDIGFITGVDEGNCARYRWNSDKEMKQVQDKSGVDFNLLSLRHTFATNCVMAGEVSLTKLADWMGNSEKVIRENYLNLNPNDSDIERLNRSFGVWEVMHGRSS